MRVSEAARDDVLSARLLQQLQSYAGPPAAVMEVCGTHTVSVARMGLRSLLPPGVRLLSGPGCPVCVTPVETFDEAIFLIREARVVLATYGDALRVPGSEGTLADAKAEGGEVRVVYAVTDALDLARQRPDREVVFLGLGFETTSPSVAWAVRTAAEQGITNFSVLSAHKALLPAMAALLADPEVRIDAFLCPGHASMVLGVKGYRPLAEQYGVPCTVAGFEPNDVLVGLIRLLGSVARGKAEVINTYPRAVSEGGNPSARQILGEVFALVDSRWRGLGTLPRSGYEMHERYARHDARRRFLEGREFPGTEPPGCLCAEVLRGKVAPEGCPLFGVGCTPEAPVGACMVSSEGACGAHYRYRGV